MKDKEEVLGYIKNYEDYLNNGQQKPQWRIDEVVSFIKVMKRIIGKIK